ncbi:hypothetical protein K1T71_014016 [Dendrolimus kikuchii]|uniref:Uncharacterized protein n=1 Tax=Dendrolimus kikuchii TaxID=765133 RepID=A0ACC1CGB6_9NEOP|nr:hypothetical protein K1T71_014016 [Dendrolimus kikuchii]
MLAHSLTQVLTGHGCFGRYLCRLGREATPGCHHCDMGDEDTALHTLQECPAWTEQRRELVALTGFDTSLPAVVRTMVGSSTGWDAFIMFYRTSGPARCNPRSVPLPWYIAS